MQLRKQAPSAALLASFLALPQLASAFYLPGVAPTSYKPNEKVPLYVNTIKPIASDSDALLHSTLSFDYYLPLFGFCEPPGGAQNVLESLGSILFGDRIKTSPFELKMGQNETCKRLCDGPRQYSGKMSAFTNSKIQQGYSLNWLIDGLPAGQEVVDQMTNVQFYSPGFLMGGEKPEGQIAFNNHYNIYVEYHEVGGNQDQLRVVGARVHPESKKYDSGYPVEECQAEIPPVHLDDKDPNGHTDVEFTYSVFWIKSNTAWATRWDKYLHVYDPKIHWFSLVNSAVIVVFLVLMVMSVLIRALRKDFARYNRLDQINLDDFSGNDIEDGVQEDSGWKLVHGDVFRTPSHPLLLSVLLGNGAQLFVMTGFTIAFALLGFLSPSNRGSLGTITILLYTVLGAVGGYVSARLYKSMNGEKWKLNIVLTPLLVPGIVFATFFFLNLFLWAKQSSGAVPFGTMLVIIAIWFIISVPLSFLGSWLGFRATQIEAPVRTNQIPRQIPPMTTTYLKPLPSTLLVGILPFGAIFVELYFIMNSIWFNRIYYMFGFLFLCYGLMIITCAAVTVLLVYMLLCSENYNWQWRAFLAAGMSAGYVFLNALVLWITKLSMSSLAGSVLYLGYSLLISFLAFILTGKSSQTCDGFFGRGEVANGWE
jgi:transmembrane 9 superfamily protein 2/4